MGGHKRSEKNDKTDKTVTKSTSHPPEVGDDVNSIGNEISWTEYMELTNNRFDELQMRLITNQECRMAEMKSELKAEITALKMEPSEVKASLEFSQAELAALKRANENRHLTDSSETANKLKQMEFTMSGLVRQVDYLDNQLRRNM